MTSRLLFIAISPTHLAFSLARLKTPLHKVDLVIVFDPKMFDIAGYHRMLARLPAVGSVHILNYTKLIRRHIAHIVGNNTAVGLKGMAETRRSVRELLKGKGDIVFCGGLINPMVRLILREASDMSHCGERIWYEDGIGEYGHRNKVPVHPQIGESGFAFMFNEDDRELPDCTVACFYPELYPVNGHRKMSYTDYFAHRSLLFEQLDGGVKKIFADFGSFNTLLSHSDYVDRICDSFSPEERRTIHLKLHPSAPEAADNALEKLGFIPLNTRTPLEDICDSRMTCYGFLSSALYRLPLLTGTATECLPSGVPQWRAHEDILRKMNVPFRKPLSPASPPAGAL